MIQVNSRVRLDDQTQFHINFSLFYVCFSVPLQIRVLLVKDLKNQTTMPLLETCRSNQIRFEKQDLEKIASTNSIFALQTVTSNLQYVGFLVTQHTDVRPNFLGKKHCIEAANPFSVPKSVINSTGHPPSFLMACK